MQSLKEKPWYDGTNYNLYCRKNECRSEIGSRAEVIMPASKGANLLCIGAMTGIHLVYTSRRGSFKGQDFKEWIRELNQQYNSQGQFLSTLQC